MTTTITTAPTSTISRTAITAPTDAQVAEVEHWVFSLFSHQEVSYRGLDCIISYSSRIFRILREYVVNELDLWRLKQIADWYSDRTWIRAVNRAEESPFWLLKNHEAAMRIPRQQTKVTQAVRCDEVVLKGIQFVDDWAKHPVRMQSEHFYLASNRERSVFGETTCLTQVSEETSFWVTQGNATTFITINQPPANVWRVSNDSNDRPVVHSIDVTGMTWEVKHDFYTKYVRRWPLPLSWSFHIIGYQTPNDMQQISDSAVGEVTERVKAHWINTRQFFKS